MGLLALVGNQASQTPFDYTTPAGVDTFTIAAGDVLSIVGDLDFSGGSLTGVVGETNGGTGQSAYTAGDMLYASAEDTLAKLAIGDEGDFLVVGAGGTPEWAPYAPSTPTLQEVYDASSPATITTDATGDITFNGSEGFQVDMDKSSTINVTGAGLTLKTTTSGTLELTGAAVVDMNAGTNLDVDAAGTVDILAGGTFSIDGTGASNVSATSGNLTLSTITGGSLIGTSAADIDLNATTGVTVDGTTVSIDGTDASNFTVTGAAKDLTLSSSGGSVNVTASEADPAAININASAGGVQINAAGLLNVDAGANADIDVTGTFDVLATGAGSIDFTGASNLSTTSGNLTLSTITSGDAIITSAAKVDINSATDTDIDATSGHISLDSTTASNFTVTGAADLSLGSTAGSLVLTGGEAAADAVTITAGSASGGIDMNAGTAGVAIDTTGGISADAAGASNFSTSSGDLTLAATTNSVNITGAENAADAVKIEASNAGGGIDINSGTSGIAMDSTGAFSGDFVGASNLTTDSGNLTIENTTSGNLILDSAATVSVGETNATKIDIAQGGVTTEVKGDLTVDGDLVVLGEKIIAKTTEVNIDDMVLFLGAGNTISASGQPGGLAVNYQATATDATTAGAGVFTAGIDAVSNPTVTTDGSVFSAGDLIMITGTTSTANNGLYSVLSDAAGTLTIYGVGITGLPQSFPQNQFVAETDTGYTITKVNISVMEASDGGVWRMGKGATLAGWAWENVGTADPTLQDAYDNGSGIITDGAGGNIAFSGTEGFTADMDKQSSINVTGADLLLSTTTSGEVDVTAAGIVDINAGTSMTLDAATGVSIDAGAASNFSTSAGALTLDGNGGVNIAGNAAEIDITTSAALDLNGGTVTMDGSNGVSIDGTGAASNFSSTGQNLTISTISSGTLAVTSAAALDMDGTTVTLDGSNGVSIDGSGAASNLTSTGQDLTISTVSSGTLALTGAALVDLNAGANLDVDVTGSTNINSTTTTDIITQSGDLTLTNQDATADIVAKLGDAAGVAEFKVTDSADEAQFLVTTGGEAKVQSSYGFTAALVNGSIRIVNGGTQIYVENTSGSNITAGQLVMQNTDGAYKVDGSPSLADAENTPAWIAAENIDDGNKGWAWMPNSVVTVQTQEAVAAGQVALAYTNGKAVPEDTALILAGMKVVYLGRFLAAAIAGTAPMLFTMSYNMIMK